MRSVKIGDKTIGDGHPTFILAEMACSHDGSVENAKKIVDGAADAKADAICVHLISMEDSMVPHYGSGRGRVSAGKESLSIYQYLCSINLNDKAWGEVFLHTKKRGLLVCALCYDMPSLKLASKLGSDAYVISPATLGEEKLLRAIAATKKPIFVRTGGAYLGEIERAVSVIKEAGNEDIILTHGFQNYPTKLEDMHLRHLQSLKQIFSLPVGFADHTDGGSEIALIVPLVALPFGANVIEKHITYDRSAKGEDFESALNPEDFKRFVKNLHEVEKTFGHPFVRPFSDDELNYRQVVKKRTVASRNIKKGERITEDNVAFKRSDEGIFPEEIRYALGRTANRDIKKNDPITWDVLAS